MKVSIITPTNNVRYLKELEDTIHAQRYQEWEWIVVMNGEAAQRRNGATAQWLDSVMDARIKIFECPFESSSVGKLKKYACSLATGDIIAEVDHDDMITPDCLEELVKAFADSEVGFVYSDCAKLLENKVFTPYLQEWGWTYKFFNWKGQKLYSMDSQPLNPGRLGYIWYAPDHIRAWRKDVYDSIGGHNEELEVCDDQDLIHRLYLVTKFRFIEKVLYIYRISGHNTWMKRCDELQKINIDIYKNNIRDLAERFAELNNLRVIELDSADEYIDAANDSAGVIYANNVLSKASDFPGLMRDIHRALAPGGLLISNSVDSTGFMPEYIHCFTRANKAKQAGNSSMFRECWLKAEGGIVEAHLEKL